MAIEVAYDATISVNSVDLSNHCKMVAIDDGQETKEATAMGNTVRVFRAGLGVPQITAEFHNDRASGSVETTLRALIGLTASSSGVTVIVRKKNAVLSTSNPEYTLVGVPDGSLTVVNDSVGEIPTISVTYKPYNAGFTIATSS